MEITVKSQEHLHKPLSAKTAHCAVHKWWSRNPDDPWSFCLENMEHGWMYFILSYFWLNTKKPQCVKYVGGRDGKFSLSSKQNWQSL